MPTIVPRFEDPAFAVDAPAPRQPVWAVSPMLDFDRTDGQVLVFNNAGEFVLANPAQSLQQLVTKRILTERLVYPGYDRDVGSDFWTMIGRGLSDLTVEKLSETYIKEALQDISLISVIDQVAAKVSGDQLYIHFRITTVQGNSSTFDFTRIIK